MHPGEDISIGASPSIQLEPYALTVKPTAHIHFVAGDDPDADMERAAKDLRKALFKSLQVELGFVNDVLSQVNEGNTTLTVESLAELCMAEIEGNGKEENHEEEASKPSRKKRSGKR